MAAGCDVADIDPSPQARAVAAGSGVLALDELGDATTGQVLAWSRDRGADALLVCAASTSSVPVLRAPALCRDRAPVVIVGDTGLELDRAPFYEKELSLRFARSYGPGRYDLSYEAWGMDYPAGQVRWTEGRNFEAVLDLLATGRLRVADLVTHTFGIDDGAAAYQLIAERAEPYLAITISYPPGGAAGGCLARAAVPAARAAPAEPGSAGWGSAASGRAEPRVGWVGAGAFSAGTLLPAFRAAGFADFTAIASASGISSHRAAERHGFRRAVSDGFSVIADSGTDIVVIVTPHDTHAELAALALRAGKHVWCEKPLALTMDELEQVAGAWQESGLQLAVGFNRRWSPAVRAAREAIAAAAASRLLV
jgi:hypothetical protein